MVTLDFCIKDYDEILSLQKNILNKKQMRQCKKDVLLLGEHSHVITLGKRPQQENNLKFSIPELNSQNIKVKKIQRGGFATYHGPGQLVGYPIFNLRKIGIGVREFIEKIEESIICVLSDFGIRAGRKPDYIGVWVGEKKIASIGVGVKRGITFHGFALNVNTDLNYFNYIIPCGLNEIQMSSMKDILGKEIPLPEVKKNSVKKILKNFNKHNEGYKSEF